MVLYYSNFIAARISFVAREKRDHVFASPCILLSSYLLKFWCRYNITPVIKWCKQSLQTSIWQQFLYIFLVYSVCTHRCISDAINGTLFEYYLFLWFVNCKIASSHKVWIVLYQQELQRQGVVSYRATNRRCRPARPAPSRTRGCC